MEGFKKCHDASAANSLLIGDPTNTEQNFDEYGNSRQSTTRGTLIFVRSNPFSTDGDVFFISDRKLYFCTADFRMVEVQKP